MELDEVMCGPYSGRGFLCGECKDDYGPAVFFFTAAKCSQVLGQDILFSLIFLSLFQQHSLLFVWCCFISATAGP